MTPTAQLVRMVSVRWRGRCEIMTTEEAEELRCALGSAVGHKQTDSALIIWTVCDLFHLPIKQVQSDLRTARVVLCRQTCMFLLRERTVLGLREIGELFPRENGHPRDHGTVSHALKTIAHDMANDRTLVELVTEARLRLETIQSLGDSVTP